MAAPPWFALPASAAAAAISGVNIQRSNFRRPLAPSANQPVHVSPGQRISERIWQRPWVVLAAPSRCDEQGVAPATFADRLYHETVTLLQGGAGTAAFIDRGIVGCDHKPEKLLQDTGASELARLYITLEDLAKAVDALASESQPPASAALASVHVHYCGFVEALECVTQAMLGAEAKPFASTKWWPHVLMRWRYHVCSLFSWGLLTQDAAAEATALLQSLGATTLVDPLAGSGWQARLWRDAGMQVLAFDSFTRRPVAWMDVRAVQDSRSLFDAGLNLEPHASALLLSWPPHSPETVGQDLLERWPGKFLVYLGEREVDEDDRRLALLDIIARDWESLCSIEIPRWPGFQDDLTLYRRKVPR